MSSARWLEFAAALANGSVSACSPAEAANRPRAYCHWTRAPLINVSAVCPVNRRCGRTERRWLPPHNLTGYREISRAQSIRCLRSKWLVFIGDSHARTAFNVLLSVLGQSPWPALNSTADQLWSEYRWPTVDTLGQCSGGLAGSAAPLPLADGASKTLAWNVSSNVREVGCTRDYTTSGFRLSFVFLSRPQKQWGVLCDLVRTFTATPPTAIVLSHSSWPMMSTFEPSTTQAAHEARPEDACDAGKYADELRTLLHLLVLGRTSTLHGHANCGRGTHAGAHDEDVSSFGRLVPPLLLWLGQTRVGTAASPGRLVRQRCLAGGKWTQTQQAALAALAASIVNASAGRASRHAVRQLDSWHLVDTDEPCPTMRRPRRCVRAPTPRLRDHVHYHLPVYLALVQNLLNGLCD